MPTSRHFCLEMDFVPVHTTENKIYYPVMLFIFHWARVTIFLGGGNPIMPMPILLFMGGKWALMGKDTVAKLPPTWGPPTWPPTTSQLPPVVTRAPHVGETPELPPTQGEYSSNWWIFMKFTQKSAFFTKSYACGGLCWVYNNIIIFVFNIIFDTYILYFMLYMIFSAIFHKKSLVY